MTIDDHQRYAFVITGATGKVARHLVPKLATSGKRILAVSRDTAALRRLYGGLVRVDICDYEALAAIEACDTLIHLAARNNDRPGTLDEFTRVNVDFSAWVCGHFDRMDGRRFVNVSSIHSLDGDNPSAYARSKELGRRRMANLLGERLDNVHIGYFHDEGYWGEKLSFLARLGSLGKPAFLAFKALKPTTSARSLADYISGPANALPRPGILTDNLTEERVYRTVTRAGDIAVGLGILLGLSPLLFALLLWIRVDSPGSAVFAQTRVGRSGERFTLYKFRTMKRDTASVGTHEVTAASVTRVGKFLRKSKLDELPQAFNLIRGDMTLVGPRPCLPTQKELLDARSERDVLAIKPGVTGYAQIRGIDMSRPRDLAESDYIYMKLQSLTLNLQILWATALGRGAGDRVTVIEKR